MEDKSKLWHHISTRVSRIFRITEGSAILIRFLSVLRSLCRQIFRQWVFQSYASCLFLSQGSRLVGAVGMRSRTLGMFNLNQITGYNIGFCGLTSVVQLCPLLLKPHNLCSWNSVVKWHKPFSHSHSKLHNQDSSKTIFKSAITRRYHISLQQLCSWKTLSNKSCSCARLEVMWGV